MKAIKTNPTGVLNHDDDVRYLHNGDYRNAFAVRHVSDEQGNSISVESILGNDMVFTLGEVVAQNKIIRVYIDTSRANSYQWEVSDGNGKVLTTTLSTTVVVNNIAGSLALVQNEFIIRFNNAPVQTYNISTAITGTETGYVEIEITTVPGWNYGIKSIGTDESAIIVSQEAHDVSVVGENTAIGGYYLLGQLWLVLASVRPLPTILSNTLTYSNDGSGVIAVGTTTPHNLVDGQAIIIGGSPTAVNANGTWIVQVIDAFTIRLLGSVFAVAGAGGTITIYPFSVGSMLVATKDINNGLWTATTVLRTTEWNLRVAKQIKMKMEVNAFGTAAYFTDNYNPYRVFYYKGAIVTDGAIQVINPDGRYAYGSIRSETRLIVGTNFFTLRFINQIQSGGAVPPGNHRNLIRLLDEKLVETQWIDVLNPISVFDASTTGLATKIFGNSGGDGTGKINVFLIENIIPGLFKYVELADIYYVEGAIVGSIVRRDILTGNTTQVIQHTGLETDAADLDVGTILTQYPNIDHGMNIDILDNRCIVSNITLGSARDFGPWTRTWKHSIKRKILTGIGSKETGTLQLGEYEDPMNVHFYGSRMINETYRDGCKLLLKSGEVTQSFWIDDCRIDNYLQGGVVDFNRGNPFGDNRRNPGGSLPDLNLTNASATEVYSFYIDFTNIDWNFLIDGVPVKDLVERIIFERVELNSSNIEVLGSGVMAMGISFHNDSDYPGTGFFTKRYNDFAPWNSFGSGITFMYANNDISNQDIIDFMYLEGDYFTPVSSNPTYPFTGITWPNNAERKFGSLYFPDVMFGNTLIENQSTDVISVYGAPAVQFNTSLGASALQFNFLAGALKEFSGFTGVDPVDYSVDELKDISKGGVGLIAARNYAKNFIIRYDHPTGTGWRLNIDVPIDNPTSPVIHTVNDVLYSGVGPDYGLYMVQYFRAKTDKFGSIYSSKYVPSGASLEYTGISLDSKEVFGGDVFTQKTWLKHRIINHVDYIQGAPGVGNQNNIFNDGTFNAGFGGGVAFYSQNRVNSQMINRDPAVTSINWQYPNIGVGVWLYDKNSTDPLLTYNKGYNWQNGINADGSFDPNAPQASYLPATGFYSLLKPVGSLQDLYRIILPLNRFDLDQSNGAIMHHAVANNELYLWQEYDFIHGYFNSNAFVPTKDGAEVIVGDGAVMRSKGQSLSSYGLRDPYAVVKGRSNGGKTTFYWPSSEYGKFIRFGLDGTVNIVDIKKMRTTFKNDTKWIKDKPNPAWEEGINGVWWDEFMEAVFVIRGQRKGILRWDGNVSYLNGDVVLVTPGPANAGSFELTDDFYRSKTGAGNVNQNPINNPAFWELIPHSDPAYYNEYCIAFSEWKNGWTQYYPFLPRIMFAFDKTIVSPRSTPNHQNLMYEYNRGELLTWFKDLTDPANPEQAVDGFIEMPTNYDPNENKDFQAYLFATKIAPYRVELQTELQKSYLVASDFNYRKEGYASTIKKDSTVTANNPNGLNDVDGQQQVFGTWLLTKLIFQNRVYQKIYNFIVKISTRDRDYRT